MVSYTQFFVPFQLAVPIEIDFATLEGKLMTADKRGPIQEAITTFRVWANSTAHDLLGLREQQLHHAHSWLCFPWRSCRGIDSLIVKLRAEIHHCDEVIRDLAEGRTDTAIWFLLRRAEEYEKRRETPRLGDRTIIAGTLRLLARQLAAIQRCRVCQAQPGEPYDSGLHS